MNRRLAITMFLLIVLLLVSSIAVEAGFADSVKSGAKKFMGGWSKVKQHLTAKQITNIALLTAILVAASMLIPGAKGITEDKRVMIAVSLLLAIVLATHLVPTANHFIWQKEPIIKARVLGFGCDGLAEDLRIANMEWVYSDCKANGRYLLHKGTGDPGTSKQAILRSGPNLSGLPAFIFAIISLAILINVFAEQLSLKDSKYLRWFLIIYFAALIANEGYSKNTIIMIGGWAVLFTVNSKLKKSMNAGEEKKGGTTFGISFAIVQIACNLFGASLLGSILKPETLTFPYLIGYFVGALVISKITGGLYLTAQRVSKEYFDKLGKDRQKEVAKLIEKGHPWGALMRDLPFIGDIYKWRSSKLKDVMKKEVDEIKEIKKLHKEWAQLSTKIDLTPEDQVKLTKIEERLEKLQEVERKLRGNYYSYNKPYRALESVLGDE